MTDYPFDSTLVADPVTFARAANASVTVYDVADTANASPLALKDLNGLPLPNPLASSKDAFLPPFVAGVPQVKLVGGGLTVTASSYKGMLENVAAALAAALAASGATDAQVAQAVATVGSQTAVALAQRFVGIPAGITDGQVPVYDAKAGRFVPGAGGTGGGAGVVFVVLTAADQPVAVPSGAVVGLALAQGPGGGGTAAWPAGIKWDGGAVPALHTGTGAVDLFTFVQNPAGGWLGTRAAWFEGVDSVAPTAPGSLAAGTPTKTTIPLSWTAATDNTGVAGYEYRANAGAWVSTGSTGTAFTVTGLTANTSYTIEVRAFDAAGNRGSAASVTASTQAAQTYQQALAATNPATWLRLDGDTANAGSDRSLAWAAPAGLAWGTGLDGGTGSADFANAAGPITATGATASAMDAGAGAFTMMALVRSTAAAGTHQVIFAGNSWIALHGATGKFQGVVAAAGGNKELLGGAWAPGTLYHVALAYDGATARLYVNGTQVASVALSGAVNGSVPGPMVGGWSPGSTSLRMTGLVDSPTVHRSALSAAQILELAQAAGAA
ncbi:LamG-like jellyroll fold domain-containing protein [Sinomonas sp. ASV322]|uniref:LamG-like jellyroll fold domain-containing protein n=1 Tax=Sinomonas sp. ASV322 TaxID=3041920 RepID=UPI0027DDCF19|nr:LamG-like jellyroll fold domain-containing protein [Sinomonas sp. ASV322]MDQ4502194.1 LamG-like jellyroll fold domain-containing protein [Sinomonas sp. ASV322]